MIFPSQNYVNGALDVGMCIYHFIKHFMNTLIYSFLKISLNHYENHILYAIKNASLLLFYHIYHPNINHHMKALICTQLQSTQLLRCDWNYFWIETCNEWPWSKYSAPYSLITLALFYSIKLNFFISTKKSMHMYITTVIFLVWLKYYRHNTRELAGIQWDMQHNMQRCYCTLGWE